MSQDTQRDQMSKKRVVYTIPGMDAAPVRRGEPYVTVMNHATGPHAFDLFDDTRTSHDVVKHALAFLRFHFSA